ncbi:MAG: 50S ribosomal protein L21 [Spirochaetes bacterium]|nr:50S ribosomal protein L21 [Spirochaetota bacterium]
MYAVAEIAGKQYIVEEGKTVEVDRLNVEPGSDFELDKVCLIKDDSGAAKIGNPYIKGAKIKAKVETETKGKKIIVFTYRKRKDSKKKQGHRQKYNVLRIEKIEQS